MIAVASVMPACACRFVTEHQKAGREGDEMDGIEQVEHAAAERQHRKGADAARAPGVGAGEEILEGEAEKQAQCQKQRDACHRRRRDHGLARSFAVARWAGVSYIALRRDLARSGRWWRRRCAIVRGKGLTDRRRS